MSTSTSRPSGSAQHRGVHAAERQLACRDTSLELGQERPRVRAGERDSRSGNRCGGCRARGAAPGVIEGDVDGEATTTSCRARRRPATSPWTGARDERAVVERRGTAARPPALPTTSTSSQASASSRAPRSASVSPRNRASAFGDPKREERTAHQEDAGETQAQVVRAPAAARRRQETIRSVSVYTVAVPPRTNPQSVNPRSAARSTASDDGAPTATTHRAPGDGRLLHELEREPAR